MCKHADKTICLQSRRLKITISVKVTIDVNIARKMLSVAGFWESSEMTEVEIFEKVLTMI